MLEGDAAIDWLEQVLKLYAGDKSLQCPTYNCFVSQYSSNFEEKSAMKEVLIKIAHSKL